MKDLLHRLFGSGTTAPQTATIPPGKQPPAVVDRDSQQVEIGQRLAAITRENDRNSLLATALNDKSAAVRLAAAARLDDPADLDQLRRDSTDKNVQRHARETLKALRAQEQQHEEQRQRIGQLLESATHHAARSWEPLYEARIDTLLEGWQAVSTAATAGEQERFAELLALARDTARRHADELAARAGAIAAKQEMIGACTELETLAQRLAQEDLIESLSAVSALRSTQQTRWDEALAQTPADTPLLSRFRTATRLLDRWLTAAVELSRATPELAALQEPVAGSEAGPQEIIDDCEARIDALRARIDWPVGTKLPPALQDLDQLAQRLAARRRSLQADTRVQLAQLRKRRNALRHMIDEGQLRVAVRAHQWLQKRIAELPAREAAQEAAALAPLGEALAKLHDWYEFASVPKKEELCIAIESLAATTDDVPARAEAVRELRTRWNTLCSADPDADPVLRARFDRAAELAWAPCAAWYEAQRKLQDDNLAARDALCTQWEAALAVAPSDAAGWRTRDRLERDWHGQWKSHEPVRWPEARASQERFKALLGRLRAQLAAERARGSASRRALIERAVALQTQEPLESALAAARELSNDWKQLGWADARDDRPFWQEFREALDAVFARRDAARDAEREARAAAAVAEAQRRADEQAKREQKIAAVRTARQAEVDAALALAAAESARMNGQDIDLAPLAAQVSALPGKSALLLALRKRLQQVQADASLDHAQAAANMETLATLTLDLEILLDAPSPPELAAARMQAKVARLNNAMRQRSSAGEDPRRALEDAWLAVGPLPAAARAPLLARWQALPPA